MRVRLGALPFHSPPRCELRLVQFVSNVMLSDISPALKARLGSIAANPDIWLRLMLGGPLHEMGVEYTEAIAVVLKRISSRMWDYSVSGVAVDRARQAVHDRTTLNWVTGRQIKN